MSDAERPNSQQTDFRHQAVIQLLQASGKRELAGLASFEKQVFGSAVAELAETFSAAETLGEFRYDNNSSSDA